MGRPQVGHLDHRQEHLKGDRMELSILSPFSEGPSEISEQEGNGKGEITEKVSGTKGWGRREDVCGI